MHRFLENQNLQPNQRIFLNQANSHKIISVLRLNINSKIILFNNTNFEFSAEIIGKQSKLIEVIILNCTFKDLGSPIKIHLAQSLLKNDKMDWVIQKAVELGVNQITPIITKQTIANPKNPKHKILHWQAIAASACCQCGRNLVPNINQIIGFNNFVENFLTSNYYKFILSPSQNLYELPKKELSKFLENTHDNKEIIILIGPEGGFNSEELSLATKNLFNVLQVGPRILRAETASIVILSILQSQFGDL